MRFVISFTLLVVFGTAAASAAEPAPSWTGFYLGVNIGGGNARSSVDHAANDPLAAAILPLNNVVPFVDSAKSRSGLLGGLQVGYNYQFAPRWVAGLEADFDGAGIKTSGETVLFNFNSAANESIKWFGTLRGRLGYLPAPDLMAYVSGGLAYGRIERSSSWVTTSGFGAAAFGGGFSLSCTPAPAVCTAGSSSDLKAGWVLGGGLEYAIWQKWTLKAEYLYVQFRGSVTETAVSTVASDPTPSSFGVSFRTGINIARLGLNYRF